MTALLLTGTTATGGMPLPVPYSLRSDDLVALALLGCFLLSAYVLSRSRKFLFLLVKDFLLNRERTSIFATSTSSDVRHLLLLVGQTCVLAAICLLDCTAGLRPAVLQAVPPAALLGLYAGGVLVVVLAGWAVYSLVGWVFFGAVRTGIWLESYSTLLYYAGLLLFPVALAAVYVDCWGVSTTLWVGLGVVFFLKMMVFYKWRQLFCNNLHGCFLLILYFCALEIVPCLMLYRGWTQLTDYLIINF